MTDTPYASPVAIAEALLSSTRVAVLTGAGMSAESGIPTFRGSRNGLWAEFDPQQLATPAAFRRDPPLVWAWYRWRTALVEQAVPNAGHQAIAQLEHLGIQVRLGTGIDADHHRLAHLLVGQPLQRVPVRSPARSHRWRSAGRRALEDPTWHGAIVARAMPPRAG